MYARQKKISHKSKNIMDYRSIKHDPFEVNLLSPPKIYFQGPYYPLLIKKLFLGIEEMEIMISRLGDKPGAHQIYYSILDRIIGKILVIVRSYRLSYEEKPLEKSIKYLKDFASIAEHYKELKDMEEQIISIFSGEIIPPEIREKIKEFEMEKTEEFIIVYNNFRKNQLREILPVLRNPKPLFNKDVKDIEEEEINILREGIKKLIRETEELSLSDNSSYDFYYGRNTLTNLLDIILQTEDVFSYNRTSIEFFKKLLKDYENAYNINISYKWLKEKGFEEEALLLLKKEKEIRLNLIEDFTKFLEKLEEIKKAL